MSDAQEAYEKEQEQLRKEYEGDVKIEAPKLPEVNPELLKDVEPLLFKGFVYAAAEVNGVPFLFKSLNHHEWEILGFTVGEGSNRREIRQHFNTFLAYGVLMVDGVNVLPRREEFLPQIVQTFNGLSEGSRQKVIRELSEVNRRATRAMMLTEVYALEKNSRFKWAQMSGLDLCSTAVSGFAGTDTLGMNHGQLLWRAINHYEDLRVAGEREWEHAKFVAGAMAGKEIQKIHAQDRRRRDSEREERQKRRDKILRFALFGEPLEGDKPAQGEMQVARTVDELAEQLENDLRGEKDFHDAVVEAYENRAREDYGRRQQTLQEYQQQFTEKFGDRPSVGATDFQGLTADDIARRMEQRHQRTVKRLSAQEGQQPKFPELADPRQQHFMDKWGSLQPAQGRVGKAVAPVNVSGPKMIPFKRGE